MAQGMLHIAGLRQFGRSLRKAGGGLHKQLRLINNKAATVVAQSARRKFVKRTGRAAASVRVSSTQNSARVSEGGTRAPYAPWLDYGGRVGRRNSVYRPIQRDGRYLYPAYEESYDEVRDIMADGLNALMSRSGIAVD